MLIYLNDGMRRPVVRATPRTLGQYPGRRYAPSADLGVIHLSCANSGQRHGFSGGFRLVDIRFCP